MANRRIKKKKLKKYEQQVPKKKLRAKRKVKKFAGSRKVSTPVSIKDKNEYYKQRKRLQSKISYYKKLGYKINYDIPKIPEKISSSAINKLKRANKNFKKYLSRVDIETGQIIKGHKYGWKIPRSRRPKIDVSKPIVSGEIPTLHNIALDEWFTYVAALFYGKAYDAFLNLTNKVISYYENDLSEVGRLFTEAKEQGLWPSFKCNYDDVLLLHSVNSLMNFFDIDRITKESVLNAVEFEGNWEDVI